MLLGTKLLRHEISLADDRGQLLLFEKVKELSDAAMLEFDRLREEVGTELENLKQNTRNNTQVGEVLMNLGRQLQADPPDDRSNSDDSSKRE